MLDRRQKINLACALVCAGMLGYAHLRRESISASRRVRCACSSASASVRSGLVFLDRRACIASGTTAPSSTPASSSSPRPRPPGWPGVTSGSRRQPPGTVPACGAPLDNLLQMFPLLEVIRKVMTGGGECGDDRLDAARNLDAGLGADRGGVAWASSASSTTPSTRCARRRLENQRRPPTRPARRCRPRPGW